MEIANNYFNNENYYEAKTLYENVISNNKRNKLFPVALKKLGEIYLLQNDTSKAIKTFKTIIDLNENLYRTIPQKLLQLNIKPLTEILLKADMKNLIRLFYYPIKVCKNESCVSLAKIYMNKQNYRLALHYWGLSDSIYPYQHFCGNAFSSNEMYLAKEYAVCYSELGIIDSSFYSLAPYIFDNWLTTNNSIVDEMIYLLNKTYKNKEYMKIFTDAESTIYVEKHLSGEYSYYKSYIKLFNRNILINQDYVNEKSDQELISEAVEYYRNTDIYKKITSN